MSIGNQEAKLTRKPKFVDVDEQLWARMKAAAAINRLTVTEAIEQAIRLWLRREE